jgi:hypothetical protein
MKSAIYNFLAITAAAGMISIAWYHENRERDFKPGAEYDDTNEFVAIPIEDKTNEMITFTGNKFIIRRVDFEERQAWTNKINELRAERDAALEVAREANELAKGFRDETFRAIRNTERAIEIINALKGER